MAGWRDGLGPWKPVVEGDRLYGRGGADDGYAAFAALLAIEAAEAAGHPARPLHRAHRGERGERQPRPAGARRGARRPHRLARAGRVPRLGLPRHRAAVGHDLAARPGRRHADRRGPHEGVHSGQASGIVPSSFRIAPPAARPRRGQRHRRGAAARAARRDPRRPRRRDAAARPPMLVATAADEFPFAGATRPMSDDPTEQLARPDAGGRRSATSAPTASRRRAGPATCCARRRRSRLSFRLPPTCDHAAALAAIERALTRRSAAAATVRFDDADRRPGWNAPSFAPGSPRRSTRRRRQPSASRPDVRRGRHDPVHGHARRAVPRRPVRGHRRARPGQQRPRTRRVPPPARPPAGSPNASPVSSAPTPPRRRPDRCSSPRCAGGGTAGRARRSSPSPPQPCDRPNGPRLGVVVADDLVATAAHTVEGRCASSPSTAARRRSSSLDARTDLALLAADVDADPPSCRRRTRTATRPCSRRRRADRGRRSSRTGPLVVARHDRPAPLRATGAHVHARRRARHERRAARRRRRPPARHRRARQPADDVAYAVTAGELPPCSPGRGVDRAGRTAPAKVHRSGRIPWGGFMRRSFIRSLAPWPSSRWSPRPAHDDDDDGAEPTLPVAGGTRPARRRRVDHRRHRCRRRRPAGTDGTHRPTPPTRCRPANRSSTP